MTADWNPEPRTAWFGHVPGLALTMALHGLLVVWAWLPAKAPLLHHAPREFVTAKLVRLGKPAKEELLPKLVEPTPAVAAPLPAVPGTSDALRAKVTDNPEAAPLKPSAKPLPQKDEGAGALERALDRARKLGKEGVEAEGSAEGSAEGTSDRAAAGDAYATLVYEAIRAEWRIPRGLIAEAELESLAAVARVRINPDGRIKWSKITRGSGNRFFDDSITDVLTRVRRLPVPPALVADVVLRSGFELEFVAKDKK